MDMLGTNSIDVKVIDFGRFVSENFNYSALEFSLDGYNVRFNAAEIGGANVPEILNNLVSISVPFLVAISQSAVYDLLKAMVLRIWDAVKSNKKHNKSISISLEYNDNSASLKISDGISKAQKEQIVDAFVKKFLA